MYEVCTAPPKDKARVRAEETLSKQIYLHPPTPIVSFKKSSDNTPSGRYGDVVQLLATVPSAPEDRKDVANQDLMVRMIRRCVGLINKQKGTAQGHAGKIRFIKLVTSALERRGC